jgi:hypothetical protein
MNILCCWTWTMWLIVIWMSIIWSGPVGLARHCSPVKYGDGGQSWHRWCFWRWLFVWLEMVAIVHFTVLIDYGGHAGILSVRVAKLKNSVINKSLTLSVVLWTDCIFIWMMSFESWWMVVVDVECFWYFSLGLMWMGVRELVPQCAVSTPDPVDMVCWWG